MTIKYNVTSSKCKKKHHKNIPLVQPRRRKEEEGEQRNKLNHSV